jgi:hypothetical protein
MGSNQMKTLALVLALLTQGCFERVVLIGDSTTACYARFNPAISANLILGPDWEVVNHAVPTLTSQDWLDTWAEQTLATYPQATAIITIGVNDWLIGLTPEQSVANIVALSGMFVKVHVTGLHEMDETGTVPNFAEYLAWRTELQAALTAAGITAWDWPHFENYDGLHHTDAGCEALGVEIAAHLVS